MLKILRSGETSLGLLAGPEHARRRGDLYRLFGRSGGDDFRRCQARVANEHADHSRVLRRGVRRKGKYLLIVEKPFAFERTEDEEENVRRLTIAVD